MKRVIIKTLLFFLPFIVLFVPIEYLLQQIPNNYSYKSNYLNTHSEEIETLILGSSHSFYGIDPSYFSTKTFNAAHGAQTLNYDFAIYKKYAANLKNLKTIIVPISYFSLWEDIVSEKDAWLAKNYTIYYDINLSHSFTSASELLSNKMAINVTNFYSYYLRKQSQITCSKLGWGEKYRSENAQDLVATGKSASTRHAHDINDKEYEKVYTEIVSVLYEMIELNKDVEIILYTPPAYKSYRENLHAAQLAKTIKTAQEIANKCSNCVYINLLEDSNYTAGDYYDADHLNEIGARKLSNFFDAVINNGK